MSDPFDFSLIDAAAERLRSGGLVAFPTETVYGLGADALSADAVERVFQAKGRPAANPLIVHVTGIDMAATLVDGPLGDDATRLMRAFWPGPLSIVLPRHQRVPGIVTGGGPSVALRCPDHPIALALLFAFGGPLVGPSANKSGTVSPTTAAHVREAFDGQTALVLDGGACQTGIESTVIRLEQAGAGAGGGSSMGGGATILRPGVVGAEQLEAVLEAPVRFGPGISEAGAPLPSPGMLASHYAPRARTVLFSDWSELELFAEEADSASIAVLSHSILAEESDLPPRAILHRLPATATEYAAALYCTLREADAPGTSLIAVHRPPLPQYAQADSPEAAAIWRAVHDRLMRAAAPR
ncbi:MAG: L-threonylcarbamoyladenylate synthase [Phycisphaerales bacterium]|nr:L-threonylcarbamoyladenylate synthase [Phycisphaerales bacterium]